jgi:flagellar biogenesis protein FliO
MTPEQYVAIFTQVAFPVALAVVLVHWILNKLNGKLDKLTDAIERLTLIVQQLVGQHRGGG